MKVYAWWIDFAHFRENCPTGVIPEWMQKVTQHNGIILCISKEGRWDERAFKVFPWRATCATKSWLVNMDTCMTCHCFTPNAVSSHLTSLSLHQRKKKAILSKRISEKSIPVTKIKNQKKKRKNPEYHEDTKKSPFRPVWKSNGHNNQDESFVFRWWYCYISHERLYCLTFSSKLCQKKRPKPWKKKKKTAKKLEKKINSAPPPLCAASHAVAPPTEWTSDASSSPRSFSASSASAVGTMETTLNPCVSVWWLCRPASSARSAFSVTQSPLPPPNPWRFPGHVRPLPLRHPPPLVLPPRRCHWGPRCAAYCGAQSATRRTWPPLSAASSRASCRAPAACACRGPGSCSAWRNCTPAAGRRRWRRDWGRARRVCRQCGRAGSVARCCCTRSPGPGTKIPRPPSNFQGKNLTLHSHSKQKFETKKSFSCGVFFWYYPFQLAIPQLIDWFFIFIFHFFFNFLVDYVMFTSRMACLWGERWSNGLFWGWKSEKVSNSTKRKNSTEKRPSTTASSSNKNSETAKSHFFLWFRAIPIG